jgi:lipopolysaccharide transport system ATP-binding protein
MSKAIKVAQLSKAYQLGEIGTGTISNDLKRFWASVRGKEDPFMKIGEVNDREVKSKSGVVWSLRDIDFDVEQGDAVGIIGRNGAGKSTLLKLLSRVTSPTSGSIKIRGRVSSLLEVGTGFHPELTGRENIYLNGAILGMRKSEIKQRFDEILAFSGVERYVDTPVKRYSSGMYLRLAFAVAAHLESEILVVDEALAVGDAEFQQKCLGKMGEVSKGQGRTVLFVSHQLNSIASLCNNCILLSKGELKRYGPTSRIISEYLQHEKRDDHVWVRTDTKYDVRQFTPLKLAVVNSELQEKDTLKNDKPIGIYIEGNVEVLETGFCVGFAVYDSLNNLLFWCQNTDKERSEWLEITKGVNKLVGWIKPHLLNEGDYRVEMMSSIHYKEWFARPEYNAPVIYFSIRGGLSKSNHWMEARPGIMAPIADFEKL